MLIFAHRGAARSRREENSLGAFAAALRAGLHLESDGRVSADGAAVLAHDMFVRRWPYIHQVRRRTAAQLAKVGVPTIDAVYAELGTDFELSVDLKVAAAGVPLLKAAQRVDAVERLWLVSDRLDVLRDLRARSADVRLVHESKAGQIGDHRDHSDRLAAAAISAQNTAIRGWTQDSVAYSHACGVLAFGSLINDRTRFDAATALGLDALYTDRLDLAGAVSP